MSGRDRIFSMGLPCVVLGERPDTCGRSRYLKIVSAGMNVLPIASVPVPNPIRGGSPYIRGACTREGPAAGHGEIDFPSGTVPAHAYELVRRGAFPERP